MSRHGQHPILRPFRRLAPLGLIFVLWISGCSVTGLLVGSVIDQSMGKGPAERLSRVREGTRVTLWLRDGSKVHGRMMGFASPPGAASPWQGMTLPAGTGIRIRVGEQDRTIPAADVSRVSTPHASWKLGMGLFGLTLDLVLVAAILAFTSG